MTKQSFFEGELWTDNDEVLINGNQFFKLVRGLGLEGKRVRITIRETRLRKGDTV